MRLSVEGRDDDPAQRVELEVVCALLEGGAEVLSLVAEVSLVGDEREARRLVGHGEGEPELAGDGLGTRRRGRDWARVLDGREARVLAVVCTVSECFRLPSRRGLCTAALRVEGARVGGRRDGSSFKPPLVWTRRPPRSCRCFRSTLTLIARSFVRAARPENTEKGSLETSRIHPSRLGTTAGSQVPNPAHRQPRPIRKAKDRSYRPRTRYGGHGTFDQDGVSDAQRNRTSRPALSRLDSRSVLEPFLCPTSVAPHADPRPSL